MARPRIEADDTAPPRERAATPVELHDEMHRSDLIAGLQRMSFVKGQGVVRLDRARNNGQRGEASEE